MIPQPPHTQSLFTAPMFNMTGSRTNQGLQHQMGMAAKATPGFMKVPTAAPVIAQKSRNSSSMKMSMGGNTFGSSSMKMAAP